ncbi:serine/threonine-protein kinase [Actinomadura parmotrematis]|uniref:non-specific serine/threonine protein kinase n=1 Tax=Actinomadura parmotrematis TaxID=2864039 RepID=A0ABS7FNV6_9ACTN|nr:serine/threonine-protein kinase [Actinomadura parmotrematis]MBW8481680.1 serine/threonine protein kinase [Actinomadura parmotrematis]
MTEHGGPLGSRYLLTERIGRGGMGVVWRALDRETGAERAVKVLRAELAEDPDALTRFVRERTALLRVRHPGVVAVHDLVVDGGRLALVMDLVVGEDLGAYRARRGGRLPPPEAAWLAAQVAEALVAVHATGLVHRDLKPANVLLDHGRGGEAPVRLADFGVAHIASGPELTASGQLVGTPTYMAPEVLRGQALSPAADVYAAGVTLYELLAGRAPFRGADLAAVLRGHLDDPLPPVPGLPAELWTLLEQSLTKEPAARIGAHALGQGLSAFARAHRAVPFALAPLPERPAPPPAPSWTPVPAGGTVPGTATHPQAPPMPPAPARRRRGGLLLGAGAALTAVALAAGVTLALASGGDGSGSGDGDRTPVANERRAALGQGGGKGGGKGGASGSPARAGRTPGASPSGTPSGSPGGARSKKPSASAKPSRPAAARTPKDTGWLCGPRTSADARGHYTTACIRTDGERVYLKATLDPVASRNDAKLIASNHMQIVLVLKTADTQSSVQYFTSPACTSLVCSFSASTVPARHAYRTLSKIYYQNVFQGTGQESPAVTF